MGKGKSRKDLQGGGKAKIGASATICSYRGLELLCHKDAISLFREGRLGLDKILQADVVFTDAKKMRQASAAEMAAAFDADVSERECMEEILLHGSYQQSTAERRALTEQRRAQLVNFFVTSFVEPRSGFPHPASRVAAALREAKFKVDIDVHIDVQRRKATKALQGILALKPAGHGAGLN